MVWGGAESGLEESYCSCVEASGELFSYCPTLYTDASESAGIVVL
ncbi:hypothetical protein NEIELOOT_02647 [Neisseria elongata subsp. glycolytica ATCC 29315]|uniref:Uncharacterized protein n=1 Tax=Neisseria elongata subsp. glycolytica ATCC 29315 TaxID=546263 RepID=D4DU88_NEIEG|nr:hypothetical protein NEIELOOT_02647 [Neisseria elongata subsp. glycolytica ATCC 29315]